MQLSRVIKHIIWCETKGGLPTFSVFLSKSSVISIFWFYLLEKPSILFLKHEYTNYGWLLLPLYNFLYTKWLKISVKLHYLPAIISSCFWAVLNENTDHILRAPRGSGPHPWRLGCPLLDTELHSKVRSWPLVSSDSLWNACVFTTEWYTLQTPQR